MNTHKDYLGHGFSSAPWIRIRSCAHHHARHRLLIPCLQTITFYISLPPRRRPPPLCLRHSTPYPNERTKRKGKKIAISSLYTLRNAFPFPNPSKQRTKERKKPKGNSEGPPDPDGSEEAVGVVEHEAGGGVGAEQLVVRRPWLGAEPHPAERLEDLAPVHAPGHHHLLQARLHLHPLDACIAIIIAATSRRCSCVRD